MMHKILYVVIQGINGMAACLMIGWIGTAFFSFPLAVPIIIAESFEFSMWYGVPLGFIMYNGPFALCMLWMYYSDKYLSSW